MRTERHGMSLFATLVVAVCVAAPGNAQQRSTLSEAESRIGMLEGTSQDLQSRVTELEVALCSMAGRPATAAVFGGLPL